MLRQNKGNFLHVDAVPDEGSTYLISAHFCFNPIGCFSALWEKQLFPRRITTPRFPFRGAGLHTLMIELDPDTHTHTSSVHCPDLLHRRRTAFKAIFSSTHHRAVPPQTDILPSACWIPQETERLFAACSVRASTRAYAFASGRRDGSIINDSWAGRAFVLISNNKITQHKCAPPQQGCALATLHASVSINAYSNEKSPKRR